MIRRARREDFAALWPLLMDAHAEQGVFRLDKVKLARVLGEAIDEERVLLAERNGAVAGTFAWAITTLHYSDEAFITDLWMYVVPVHRRSMAALRLRNALRAEARGRGLPLVVGVFGKRRDGARLFGTGFVKAGELFLTR